MRVICFANKVMPSMPCGGGAGVAYRLHKANLIYKRFTNITFVFLDKVVVYGETVNEYLITRSSNNETYSIAELMQYQEVLVRNFLFSQDDIFLFHDLESFYSLYHVMGGIKHSIVVYHGQGSLYHEAVASGMEENETFWNDCLELTKFSIENSEVFAFPSIGAKQALVDTMPEIRECLENHTVEILYNGCTPIIQIEAENQEINSVIDYLNNQSCMKFLSVCTLNDAKGIDTVPEFFRRLSRDRDFVWVLIGNGAKADVIQEKILRYNLSERVIWLSDWISNNNILRIMECTDFYIMNHRFSIFDFSTIEAMHMGNIPVLSPVGGNLEMVRDDSGYFLKSILDTKGFLSWLSQEEDNRIDSLKQQNRDIAQEWFSEQAFLENYVECITKER